MLAYHNDPSNKAAILRQLEAHRIADQLIQGYGYWEDGRGCAVGCTLHSSDHAEYESRFGIPQMLARLEDCIFEGVPVDDSRQWPERFMSAVPVGADLSLVGWKFLHWLLTNPSVNPGVEQEMVRDAVKQCADVIALLAKGLPVNKSAAMIAQSTAAKAVKSAKNGVERGEEWSPHWSAANAAWSAARSAKNAAESAAWIAASSAANAAQWSAEWIAARSSAKRARKAAYQAMADKLIELIEEAPVSGGENENR